MIKSLALPKLVFTTGATEIIIILLVIAGLIAFLIWIIKLITKK